MRAWLRDHVDPVFQKIVRRLDPSTELDDHLIFVGTIEKRWPAPNETNGNQVGMSDCLRLAHDALRQSTSETAHTGGSPEDVIRRWRSLDCELDPTTPTDLPATAPSLEESVAMLAQPGIWSSDAKSAEQACAFVLRGLSLESWAQTFAPKAAADAISALPPKEWFIYKRGTFYGTASLLHVLIEVNARMPDWTPDPGTGEGFRPIRTGTLDVLDRLIRHIEVRRDDALRFATPTLRPDADPLLERLRFAMALIEAAELFRDLRYLNSAMKLVDNTLVALRRQPPKQESQSIRRHLAYVTTLAAQEALMRKVSSS